MKNILLQFKIALALAFLSQLATAQEAENPYAIFGSTQKVLTEPTGVIEEVLHIGSESDEMSYENQMARREVLRESIRRSRVEKYRFGFNGMERDDDFAMGSYDFGARLYNPTIGRWNARDPLESKYPNISTYTFVANSPLMYVDPNGKEVIDFDMYKMSGTGLIRAIGAYVIFANTQLGASLLERFSNGNDLSFDHLKGKIGDLSKHDLYVREHGSVKGDHPIASGQTFAYVSRADGVKVELSKLTRNDLEGLELSDIKFTLHITIDKYDKDESSLTLGHEAFVHLEAYINLVSDLNSGNFSSIEDFLEGAKKVLEDKAGKEHKAITVSGALPNYEKFIKQALKQISSEEDKKKLKKEVEIEKKQYE